MRIAGHVSRAMLSRYSHVRMEAKRRALDEIAARQIAADEKRKNVAERQQQVAATAAFDETFPWYSRAPTASPTTSVVFSHILTRVHGATLKVASRNAASDAPPDQESESWVGWTEGLRHGGTSGQGVPPLCKNGVSAEIPGSS